MDFFTQIFQMLAGSVYLLVTRPLECGLVAYLSTTFIIFVALPGCVGILVSIIGKTPCDLQFDRLIGRWWRWFVATPLSWAWRGLTWLAPRLARGLWAVVSGLGRGLWRFVRYGLGGRPTAPPPTP